VTQYTPMALSLLDRPVKPGDDRRRVGRSSALPSPPVPASRAYGSASGALAPAKPLPL